MARELAQPSMASVAAAAGVSPTTVSHALSGKRAVSAETRERILQTIEQQKYRPNMVARSLRSRKTQSIALIVADITNPYYPAIARAVHDGLVEAGYVSLIGNTDGIGEVEQTVLEEMVARGVDGVIMRPMALTGQQVRDIVGPVMPAVLITDEDEGGPVDRVNTDDAHGIHEAVAHLRDIGVDELGFIGDPLAATSMSRHAAFVESVESLGLHAVDEWFIDSEFTRDGGYAAAKKLLSLERPPRGIVCANDLIAIGVIQAARDLRVAVPQRLAVVGFDDIDTAALMSPALTTVLNPAAAVGAACADLMLRRIDDPALPYQHVSLPTRLVIRESA
jgi:LacI family transcriptional regulator